MTPDFPSFGKTAAPPAGWRMAVSLLVLLAVTVVLAAVTAVAFQRFLLPHLPATWSEAVLHRGAGKIMSRTLQLWLVILLPLGLRFSGWRGWRDCGWRSEAEKARPIWKDILAGLLLGVATLGSLAAFMFLTGRRLASPLEPGTLVSLVILGYVFSATLVGVFEETIARGIIFRVWSRAWGAVIAALVSSLLFAAAHFIEPSAAAFQLSSFWSAVAALGSSTLHLDTTVAAFWIRFLNLAFLGLALCAMVRLTGTIWLAVGAHAGWVWSIKVHDFFTDPVPPELYSRIWGGRGDLTDSVVATVTLLMVLLVVLGLIWRRERRTTTG